jgi:PAS domain S-box-containing protein
VTSSSHSDIPFSAMSAELLEMLFQQLPLGVALFNTNLRMIRSNHLFAEMVEQYTPLTSDQVIPGIGLLDISPGNEALFQTAVARVFAGETVRADAIRTQSGGKVSYWDGLMAPVFLDGKVVGLLDVVMDVTEKTLVELRVQQSEAALRALVQNARRFAIYRIELDDTSPYGGRVVFASPSMLEIVGMDDPNNFAGWFHPIHPDDQARVEEANLRSLKNGEPYNQTARVFHKYKNDWVWVHTISNPYRNEEGKITHFDGMVIDMTDQISLKEAERRRAAAEGLRDILRMINSNRPLQEILQTITIQAKNLLQADSSMMRQVSKEKDLVYTVASSGLPPDFDAISEQPFYQAAAEQVLLSGQPVIIEDIQAEYLPRPLDPLYDDPQLQAGIQASLRHYNSLLKTPIFLNDQIFGAISLHFVDRRKLSQEDLQLVATLADQAALAIENARLIEKVKETAVLEERGRLARDLHDAVTQTLFSTTLTAEVLPKIWETNPAQGRKKLEELRELTRGALAEMRTLLIELRPAALEDADLRDLLRHLANAFIARARIPVKLSLDGGQNIPLHVKVAFYRVAQEALNNIAKHADASQVSIILQEEQEGTLLKIEDNGNGFEPSTMHPNHFGLRIMQERAEQVGAVLKIESAVGVNTSITIFWKDIDPPIVST